MPGQVQQRTPEVLGEVVETIGERTEQRMPAPPVAPAEARRGLVDRPPGGGARSTVERMGVLDQRPPPRQPVTGEIEAPRERVVERQRMGRRALVVDQPRQRQLAGSRAATEAIGRLEHRHLDALGGEGEGGSEPVRPTAHHDGARHAPTAPPATGTAPTRG